MDPPLWLDLSNSFNTHDGRYGYKDKEEILLEWNTESSKDS
jgi:hypothetical protein